MSKNTSDGTPLLRGYVIREGSVWTATCLDLTLAAQGNNPEEALQRLMGIVEEYVKQAMGEYQAYKDQLLNRRAPFSEYLKYHCLKSLVTVLGWFQRKGKEVGADSSCGQIGFVYSQVGVARSVGLSIEFNSHASWV